MSLYYYHKYVATFVNTTYENESAWTYVSTNRNASAPGYDDYSFTEANGFETAGNYISSPVDTDITYAVFGGGTSASRYSHASDTGDPAIQYILYIKTCNEVDNYSQGALVSKNAIIGDDGTYPANGYYDGFWWVKGDLFTSGFLGANF